MFSSSLSPTAVNLTYIIEANLTYAEEVKSEFCLDSTTILHFDDFDKAVTDERWVCWFHILSYSSFRYLIPCRLLLNYPISSNSCFKMALMF